MGKVSGEYILKRDVASRSTQEGSHQTSAAIYSVGSTYFDIEGSLGKESICKNDILISYFTDTLHSFIFRQLYQ
jgi:hypothetical protein